MSFPSFLSFLDIWMCFPTFQAFTSFHSLSSSMKVNFRTIVWKIFMEISPCFPTLHHHLTQTSLILLHCYTGSDALITIFPLCFCHKFAMICSLIRISFMFVESNLDQLSEKYWWTYPAGHCHMFFYLRFCDLMLGVSVCAVCLLNKRRNW